MYFSKSLCIVSLVLCSFISYSQTQYQNEIKAYLESIKKENKLSDTDIDNFIVTDQYTDQTRQITYTYLNQQFNGIRIFNAVSTCAIKDGKVVHFANKFYGGVSNKIVGSSPSVLPQKAIEKAFEHLGIKTKGRFKVLKKEKSKNRIIFKKGKFARENIRTELVYQPIGNIFRLAYDVSLAAKGKTDWWNIRIDALTGEFLDKNSWTTHCDFGYGVTEKKNISELAIVEPMPEIEASGYRVYPLPIEAPSFGSRQLIINPENPTASPYSWHDVDGVPGAEYTITQGNNVYAYEDADADDQPGYSPDGGSALSFDFPIDLNQQPSNNLDPIITNLFYVNNMIHDITYIHGFDEQSGNYQANNYGNGGIGDDYVLAEAQDGSGTDNANFSAPEDGYNGRMQMYLWSGSQTSSLLTVNNPLAISGNYTAVEAGFGPGFPSPITEDLVLVVDDTSPISDACETITNAASLSGKIALIDRGLCTFIEKLQAVESAGAIAAIVINNQAGAPFTMGGTGTTNIPSVMISQSDGNILKNSINAGNIVNVTISTPGGPSIDFDCSLDNGIMSHEYGHGISIRLTGGPSNSSCLDNEEQGGEGWSDWLSLILTIKQGDVGATARGIGTYVAGETATGSGIRRYPYSTDMNVNPQTYGTLAQSNEVHDVGEIWCDVIWDLTWNLIDEEGYTSDWASGTGGNITAMELVLQGMKLQPCSPGFLDARDAILAADDLLYGGNHRCLIWETFARRGMGFNADQGSSNVAGDEIENFDTPTFCQIATISPTANFNPDVITSCTGLFHFTDASTNIPQQWSWNFGDGTTSTQINPTHTYSVQGNYTVELTVTNSVGTSTTSQVVSFSTLQAPTISGSTTVCIGNSASLNANVTSGNIARWILSGNVVSSSSAFTTPALFNNTTYQVQQIAPSISGNVGPVDNTFGEGDYHNSTFEGQIYFTTYKPMKVISCWADASGDSIRTINLYDANNTLIQSVSINIPNGQSTITLNLEISEPGNYAIGVISPNGLFRNSAGASYPYTISNLVSITGSNAGQDYYYYLYNWQVEEIACESPVVDVPVTVTDGPIAGFTFSNNQLTYSFNDASSGNPTSWAWSFGDGNTSADQNPIHNYTQNGSYNVSLTVSNGICSQTYQETIIVTTVGIDPPISNTLRINLFPNPSKGEVILKSSQDINGKSKILICTIEGRLLKTFTYERQENNWFINLSSLSNGTYLVKLQTEFGVAVKRVTLVD